MRRTPRWLLDVTTMYGMQHQQLSPDRAKVWKERSPRKMADWHDERLIKDEDFQEDEVWAFGKRVEESNPKLNISEKLERYIPHHQQQQKQQQSAAPIRIPDWSKGLNHGCYKDDYDVSGIHGDDEMMPPHEYINRRVARSQIASFSMCEGVGRTLKGRDLSKLRNAILTKTGFLE
ncbi:hypothetical protein L1987_63288 [Smallanthus sonchifolius]|uniref:Uncharacterized protein n=1 Tax=Smallanthus sonchifolius TaxID=185202 RepID=A0ACB9CCQ6_9ASTR|nr:hypothetical protein L1987_63288 [Smallanthus sonchifolius]